MMTEDYVSFDTAKLLKEKGFDEPLKMTYWGNGVLSEWVCAERNSSIHGGYEHYTAPTLQMAMKWLKEVHGLCLFLIPAVVDDMLRPGYVIYPKCDNKWEWCASKNDGSKATFGCDINKDYCDSYEQACEAAIKYCLENLI